MNNKLKIILCQHNLYDLWKFMQHQKVTDINTIMKNFEQYSHSWEVLIVAGQLELLGAILITSGVPIKFVCIQEQDFQERFNRRFEDER